MEVKSTLKVINAAGLKSHPGICKGQTMKQLVGFAELPTDRVRGSLATCEAGALEELHWHPIESFYFVISGHATARDIEGREYDVGPGSFISTQPGIAGA